MTPAEAAALLTFAATMDNRKPDADTARVWAGMLDGLAFEDCRDAIAEHYRNKTEWLMPAHIEQFVKNRRWSRIQAVGYVEPPRELDGDPARENAWTKALNKAAGDGLEREAAIATANQSQRIDPQPLAVGPSVDPTEALKAIRAAIRDPHARYRADDVLANPTTTPSPADLATRED